MEKKRYMILSAAMAVSLLLLLIFMAFMLARVRTNELSEKNYSELDLGQVADGRYLGEEFAGLVKVRLEVTVGDSEIEGIDILLHRQIRGKAAEAILADIIRAQSVDVDAISGATSSSEVIKAAVYNALNQ
ncbi:MAG: FMN-binding protein [Clostridiaceae bacterium]|nr:FMN-binding protein [Clostridiaceae bacterium]